MCIFRRALLILVVSDNNLPEWVPAPQFDVVDSRISSSWHFAIQTGARTAVWGYQELATDPSYIDQLGELNPSALEIFWRRTKEI